MGLVRYLGPARRWIKDYKYSRALHLEADFAKLIAHYRADIVPFIKGAVLVPVPLHWAKRALRGFNQAEEICKILKKQCADDAEIRPLVLRSRWTPPQSRLHREARAQNVHKAFSPNPKLDLSEFCHRRIVLVDDLFTSGATMRECAKVLRHEGIMNIDAFSLARN
jgi:ComF family protein